MQGTNRRIFEHRLRQLIAVTVERQGTAEVSFGTGFWESEEGYKRDILDCARKELQLENWGINNKFIVKSVCNAIYNVKGADDKQQNLVSKESQLNVMEAFLKNDKRVAEVATWFRALYQGGNIAEASVFEGIARLLIEEKVYDAMSVTAYLFFIKDPHKYMPVRKNGYRERLPKLDISAECVKTCTWNNYQFLLSQMKTMQGYLKEYFPNAELIDAQSFLWMMWLVDSKTPEYDIANCVLK